MNTCEVCDKKFHSGQAWATICPKCVKEISDYRAGLEKEATAGQDCPDKKIMWQREYYRKHNKPRRCIICNKEFYGKGCSEFCEKHRYDYTNYLDELAGGRWTKTTKSDIVLVMKKEYADSLKPVTVEAEMIQPLNSFDKHILQLGRC